MSRFLSRPLARLEAYVPGEQPQDRKYIKLNTNESPYPPSKGVIKAVNKKEVRDLRLYCDPECRLLKEAMAKHYGVDGKNVFLAVFQGGKNEKR